MKQSPARQQGRRHAPLAVVVALAMLLGACGTGGDDRDYICPSLILVPDATRMTQFNDGGQDLTDVRFEAELVEPDMNCRFDDAGEAIEGQLVVRFVVNRGPADVNRSADFRYFIAIATGQSRRIVARQEFPLSVPFSEGQTRVAVIDEVEPRIPIGPDEDGSEYQVFVGFALSRDQLEYNRNQR